MPKKLLLADDSVTIQKVVAIIFAHEDLEVTSVDNGEDALAMARDLVPDIILADAALPRKTGYEVCEAIKADPALAQIPVLLLAGTFEPFDENRARAAGADDFIQKPFESQALIDRVNQLVYKGAPPKPVTAPVAQAAPPAQAPVRPAVSGIPGLPRPGATPIPGVPGLARPGMVPPGARSPGPAIPGPRPGIPGMMPARPPGPVAPPGARPLGAAAPAGIGRPAGTFPLSGVPGVRQGPLPPGIAGLPRPGTPAPAGLPRASAAPRPPGAVPVGGPRPLGAAPGPRLVTPVPGVRISTPLPSVTARRPPPNAAAPAARSQKDPFGFGISAPPPSQTPELDLTADEVAPAGAQLAAASDPTPAALASEPSAERARPPAHVGDGSEALLREALSKASRETIEKIAWEVVPQLAEAMIREELDRLVKERQTKT